jgi:hypothetical protein
MFRRSPSLLLAPRAEASLRTRHRGQALERRRHNRASSGEGTKDNSAHRRRRSGRARPDRYERRARHPLAAGPCACYRCPAEGDLALAIAGTVHPFRDSRLSSGPAQGRQIRRDRRRADSSVIGSSRAPSLSDPPRKTPCSGFGEDALDLRQGLPLREYQFLHALLVQLKVSMDEVAVRTGQNDTELIGGHLLPPKNHLRPSERPRSDRSIETDGVFPR